MKDYSIGMQEPQEDYKSTESDEPQLEQEQQVDPATAEPDDHEAVEYEEKHELEQVVADDHDGQHEDAEHEDPLMAESKNRTVSHSSNGSKEGEEGPPPDG